MSTISSDLTFRRLSFDLDDVSAYINLSLAKGEFREGILIGGDDWFRNDECVSLSYHPIFLKPHEPSTAVSLLIQMEKYFDHQLISSD